MQPGVHGLSTSLPEYGGVSVRVIRVNATARGRAGLPASFLVRVRVRVRVRVGVGVGVGVRVMVRVGVGVRVRLRVRVGWACPRAS